MDIVDLVIIIVAALPIIMVRDLRTLRAAAFLGLLSGLEVLGSALPQPAQFVVKSAAIWSYIVVFLWFQHVLAGRSAREAKIDRAMRSIAKDADALLLARPVDLADRTARRELILERISALQPPNPSWVLAVELFRSYYRHQLLPPEDQTTVARDPRAGSTERELEQVRHDLDSAWKSALRPGRGARP